VGVKGVVDGNAGVALAFKENGDGTQGARGEYVVEEEVGVAVVGLPIGSFLGGLEGAAGLAQRDGDDGAGLGEDRAWVQLRRRVVEPGDGGEADEVGPRLQRGAPDAFGEGVRVLPAPVESGCGSLIRRR